MAAAPLLPRTRPSLIHVTKTDAGRSSALPSGMAGASAPRSPIARGGGRNRNPSKRFFLVPLRASRVPERLLERVPGGGFELVQLTREEMVRAGHDEERPAARRRDGARRLGPAELVVARPGSTRRAGAGARAAAAVPAVDRDARSGRARRARGAARPRGARRASRRKSPRRRTARAAAARAASCPPRRGRPSRRAPRRTLPSEAPTPRKLKRRAAREKRSERSFAARWTTFVCIVPPCRGCGMRDDRGAGRGRRGPQESLERARRAGDRHGEKRRVRSGRHGRRP